MFRAPIWSPSTTADSRLTCSGSTTSVTTGRPVRSLASASRSRPSHWRPWKECGEVRGLKTPPRRPTAPVRRRPPRWPASVLAIRPHTVPRSPRRNRRRSWSIRRRPGCRRAKFPAPQEDFSVPGDPVCRRRKPWARLVDEVRIGYRKDECRAQPINLGWCAGGFKVLYPSLDAGAGNGLVENEQSIWIVMTQMLAVKPCLRNRRRYQVPPVDGTGFPIRGVSTWRVRCAAAASQLPMAWQVWSTVPACTRARVDGRAGGHRGRRRARCIDRRRRHARRGRIRLRALKFDVERHADEGAADAFAFR